MDVLSPVSCSNDHYDEVQYALITVDDEKILKMMAAARKLKDEYGPRFQGLRFWDESILYCGDSEIISALPNFSDLEDGHPIDLSGDFDDSLLTTVETEAGLMVISESNVYWTAYPRSIGCGCELETESFPKSSFDRVLHFDGEGKSDGQ